MLPSNSMDEENWFLKQKFRREKNSNSTFFFQSLTPLNPEFFCVC